MYCTSPDITNEVAKYVDVLSGEVFRIIEDFPRYYVSNMARVFTTHQNKLLKVQNSGWGYNHVSLTGADGKVHHKRLHRLVAQAFLENPNNLPDVHHKDGNRKNNKLSNVEWISTKRNIEIGKGKAVYLINIATGQKQKCETIQQAYRQIDVGRSALMRCLNGELESVNGYKIEYVINDKETIYEIKENQNK